MASSEVMEKKKEKENCGFHFLIFEDWNFLSFFFFLIEILIQYQHLENVNRIRAFLLKEKSNSEQIQKRIEAGLDKDLTDLFHLLFLESKPWKPSIR